MLESRGNNYSDSMQRTILSVALGLIFNIFAAPAWALNLGKGVLGSTLGQPLNFTVNVNSEPEEGITPECVRAEVFSGENKLAPGAVRITSDASGTPTQFTARVSTNSVIDEPVVTVAVALGCPTRATRRFVLFVDPPLVTFKAEVSADPAVQALPPESASEAPKPIIRSTTARSAGAGFATVPRGSAAPKRVTAAMASDAVLPPRRDTAPFAAVPEGSAASKPVPKRPPALVKAPTPAAVTPAPRLKLDPAPSMAITSAPAAASAAPSAEVLAANAASPTASASAVSNASQEVALSAALRVAALEESLQKLKTEAEASRKSIDALQATVRDANASRTPSSLVWVLAALCAALAVTVAALLWSQARRRRDPAWWKGNPAEPQASLGGHSISAENRSSRLTVDVSRSADSELAAPPLFESRRDFFAVASGSAPLTTPVFPTAPLVKPTANSSASAVALSAANSASSSSANAADSNSNLVTPEIGLPRELSVEELIDLEQQAEFFVVLGQDEAAIDLLMTNVRSTGGQSPMPYIKLLEIYRRSGNLDAYNRIRGRFNQRFKAVAPSAAADPTEGRVITEYPEILNELIAVWPTSSRAVGTLGRWLMRTDSDLPDSTLIFDFPAFSELLFLHSLARDLSAREPQAGANSGTSSTGGIDVLLPLAAQSVSAVSSLQAARISEASGSPAESSYDLDLDLSLALPLATSSTDAADAADTTAATDSTNADGARQSEHTNNNASAKSDFMSLNIDSRFQS